MLIGKDLYARAADFIAFFEGFVSTARWDVNAYRLGFGSDTEGPEQVKVERGMTTTRERALENLAARIPQFEAVIIKQITPQSWPLLKDSERIALLDFAYNYGDLTATLAEAARRQADIGVIIQDIEAREGDDHSVNLKRRYAEAALIASGL